MSVCARVALITAIRCRHSRDAGAEGGVQLLQEEHDVDRDHQRRPPAEDQLPGQEQGMVINGTCIHTYSHVTPDITVCFMLPLVLKYSLVATERARLF